MLKNDTHSEISSREAKIIATEGNVMWWGSQYDIKDSYVWVVQPWYENWKKKKTELGVPHWFKRYTVRTVWNLQNAIESFMSTGEDYINVTAFVKQN